MTRVITPELKAAQEASFGTPAIELIFTSKDELTTHDYSLTTASTNRLKYIEHWELPSDDFAIIVLRNEDLSIPDLRGYYVDIGYGFDTTDHGGSGLETSATARLWVEHQQYISEPGTLIVVLTLEGVWRRMMRKIIKSVGDAPDFTYKFEGLTYYKILEFIIEDELGYELRALGQHDDGIIDTTVPEFEINKTVFEYAGLIVERLMNHTKSYLRAEAGLIFRVRYPLVSASEEETKYGDVILQYYSDQAFQFYVYDEKKSVLVPNHIIVYGNQNPDTGDWDNIITAEAEDVGTNEQRVTEIQQAGGLRSQGELQNLADAILLRYKAQQTAGRLVIPHDCRLELYDRILITNSRGT
ncbi:hypothetical protein LCGC14_0430810 [marine sediment metagenome]|uniref:Uncharacterized protein n=1 Tax=marine sediment metagenome TaxID=412755 RepID=A0A0F9VA20_9ZZZZ